MLMLIQILANLVRLLGPLLINKALLLWLREFCPAHGSLHDPPVFPYLLRPKSLGSYTTDTCKQSLSKRDQALPRGDEDLLTYLGRN